MDTNEEKQNIINKLKEINEEITEDNLKNAAKEDVIEYLMLVDKLKATLMTMYEE